MSTDEAAAYRQRLRQAYARFVPHSAALGMRMDEIGECSARLRLPCRPEFVGDPERGLIHTGIVTTLIDSTSGAAVCARIGKPQRIATLDLRVDYLRPAALGADLVCEAECYRLARQIAFVRARVWQGDPEQPIAESLSTFMRSPTARKAAL